MNQNNRNNNRRRGRGGNRGQGGGNQGNRIDSRARGNAPQLLEKYKKLAHDASLNGDRVQTEYYLQFADHYFRVVADSRTQRDDQRPQRDGDRERERDNTADDDELETDREPNPGRNAPRRRDREDDEDDGSRSDEGPRGLEGAEAEVGKDNPFVRDTRPRPPRARGRGAANDETRGEETRGKKTQSDGARGQESGFDAGILPPSIPREETPVRPARTRVRRTRPVDDGDKEALEEAS